MCTQEEIAAHFRCSDTTLHRWCQKTFKASFEDIYKTLSVPAKRSLRSKLFQMAIGDESKKIKPNLGAIIWLSKQYLGMTEKVEATTANIHTNMDEKQKAAAVQVLAKIGKYSKPEV